MECFFRGRPFQLSLMYESKAGAYKSKAPFSCNTSGFTHKYQTKLERLKHSEKHLNSLQIFLNYCCKKFYNFGSQFKILNPFFNN